MLIKRNIDDPIVKKFKVKNLNYQRQLRMMWKKQAPRMEYKNLFTREWRWENAIAMLPIAAFIDKAKQWRFWYMMLKWNDEIVLRPEQEDVINMINKRAGLIVMKTWAGKSITIAKIIDKFKEPTLIATHSQTCLNDMKKTIKKCFGIEPWEYRSKKKNIQHITITTHSSLTEKYEEFKSKFWLVIIDECDRWFTDKMYKALNNLDCEWIFWFTWTPQTKELSTESMCLVYWDMIQSEVVDNNWYQLLPTIEAFIYKNWMEYPYTEWHELEEMLVNDEIRREAQCSIVNRCFETWRVNYGLFLVRRKEDEAEVIYNYFKEHHKTLPVILIDWDTTLEADKEWIDYLKSQWKWLIVWTVWKLWRWADVPMIDWVFLFFPNRFESSTIQAVGRWLRAYPWKDKCMLYDRVDHPILRGQYRERKKTYKKEYWVEQIEEYTINYSKRYTKG